MDTDLCFRHEITGSIPNKADFLKVILHTFLSLHWPGQGKQAASFQFRGPQKSSLELYWLSRWQDPKFYC